MAPSGMWPGLDSPMGLLLGLQMGSQQSLASSRGKPPILLQLPTTKDRGAPGREVFHPESKTPRDGPQSWAEPLATSLASAGVPSTALAGHTSSLPKGTSCSCLLSPEPREGLVLCRMTLPHILRRI